MSDPRQVFDAFRAYKRAYTGQPLNGLDQADVDDVNAALSRAEGRWKPPQRVGAGVSAGSGRPRPASVPDGALRASQKGIDLIHSFEQCKLTAYPDPGSRDGTPWTVGWGATGPGIQRGTVWTQAQADERFRQDIGSRETRLNAILAGARTTQAQYDAMLSLGYNIGMGALESSTVMRMHKAGEYVRAAAAFAMWNKNDGKVMKGLTRRRAAEAAMYKGE